MAVQKSLTQIQLPSDPAGVLQAGTKQYIDAGVAASQPLDSDLTAIAGLSPSNDDVVQRKAGAWTNRTPAQLKVDLSLAKGDVGLGSVDNTADSAKPVSTAQQTALDGKVDESVLTAKGDLYVATGSATPDSLAVGSNGQVLTADSAQTAGVKWAAAGGSTGIATHDYPIAGFGLVAATVHPDALISTSLAVAAGQMYVNRMWLAPNTVVTGGAIYIATAGTTPGSTNASGFVMYSDAGTQLRTTTNDYTLFTSTGWKSKAFSAGTYTAGANGEWVRVGVVPSTSGTNVNYYQATATVLSSILYNTTLSGTQRRTVLQTAVTTFPASITPTTYGTAQTIRPFLALY